MCIFCVRSGFFRQKNFFEKRLTDYKTFFYFERMQPQKLRYAVEVFERGSRFDSAPDGNAQEYIRYCAEAGWQYLCTAGQLNIFVTADEAAVPIETDENVKFELVSKAMLHSLARRAYVVLLAAFQIFLLDFEEVIADNTTLLCVLGFAVFACLMLFKGARFLHWTVTSKRQLSVSLPVSYPGQKALWRRIRLKYLTAAVFLLPAFGLLLRTFSTQSYGRILLDGIYLAGFLAAFVVAHFLRKQRRNRKFNERTPLVLFVVTLWCFDKKRYRQKLRVRRIALTAAILPLLLLATLLLWEMRLVAPYLFYPMLVIPLIFRLFRTAKMAEHRKDLQRQAEWAAAGMNLSPDSNALPTDAAWGAKAIHNEFGSKRIVEYEDCLFVYTYARSAHPLTETQIRAIVQKLEAF